MIISWPVKYLGYKDPCFKVWVVTIDNWNSDRLLMLKSCLNLLFYKMIKLDESKCTKNLCRQGGEDSKWYFAFWHCFIIGWHSNSLCNNVSISLEKNFNLRRTFKGELKVILKPIWYISMIMQSWTIIFHIWCFHLTIFWPVKHVPWVFLILK